MKLRSHEADEPLVCCGSVIPLEGERAGSDCSHKPTNQPFVGKLYNPEAMKKMIRG